MGASVGCETLPDVVETGGKIYPIVETGNLESVKWEEPLLLRTSGQSSLDHVKEEPQPLLFYRSLGGEWKVVSNVGCSAKVWEERTPE